MLKMDIMRIKSRIVTINFVSEFFHFLFQWHSLCKHRTVPSRFSATTEHIRRTLYIPILFSLLCSPHRTSSFLFKTDDNYFDYVVHTWIADFYEQCRHVPYTQTVYTPYVILPKLARGQSREQAIYIPMRMSVIVCPSLAPSCAAPLFSSYKLLASTFLFVFKR